MAFVVVLAPFAAVTWGVEPAAWKYIVPSGAARAGLRRVARNGVPAVRASVVYPIARGLAPVATLVFAVAIVELGAVDSETPASVVVAAGVLLVRGGARRPRRGARVAIAAAIGGYTLIDRYASATRARSRMRCLVMIGPALVYPPLVGLRSVRAAVSPTSVAVGVLSAAAYLLVLLALRRASAPSVSAVRETGVVIATGFAAVFLHERVGPARLAGAVLVVAGIALLAL